MDDASVGDRILTTLHDQQEETPTDPSVPSETEGRKKKVTIMADDEQERAREGVAQAVARATKIPDSPISLCSALKSSIGVMAMLMVVLGVGLMGCGVASFAVLPRFQTRQSLDLEIKWINIVTVFSGASAIIFAWKRSLTTMCSAIVFTLLTMAISFSTFVVSGINMSLREQDKEYYDTVNKEMARVTGQVYRIDQVLCALGFLAFLISCYLGFAIFQVGGKRYNRVMAFDKPKMNLSMLGMTQAIAGLAITGFWVGIEMLSQGSESNLHDVPGASSEILSHGMVITVCGVMQMAATSMGTKPMFVCATVLNAAVFIIATFFTTKPLSIMYFVIRHSDGSTSTPFVDSRLYMCALLVVIYAALALIAVYSLIRFVHSTSGESNLSRADHVYDHRRQLLVCLSITQVAMGVFYALVEIFAVVEYFLYKLDFTPLPLFIVGSGLFAYGAVHMGSVTMAVVTACAAVLSGTFSLRDIYLFLYHTIAHGHTPDNPDDEEMSGFLLTYHMIIALMAVTELTLSAVIFTLYMNVVRRSAKFTVNKNSMQWSTGTTYVLAVIQLLCAVVCIAGGIVMLQYKSKLFLAYFGDSAILLGCLIAIAFVLQVLCGKFPILLLPSIGVTVAAFTLVWQQLDSFAYFIHNHLAHMGTSELELAHPQAISCFCVFAALVIYTVLSLVAIMVKGSTVEDGKLSIVGKEGTTTTDQQQQAEMALLNQ